MQLQEDIYTSGDVQTHTLCPMLKNDSYDLTTYYTDTDRDSFLQTDRLFCTGTVTQQLDNCSPKDRKEKLHRFAFLKISFADTHFAHLLLPNFYLFCRVAKAKEPNLANTIQKTKIVN